MSEQASVSHSPPSVAAEVDPAEASLWARVQHHKVVQWGLAYLGAALALGQASELIGNAFQWPDLVSRLVIVALVVGFPVALTLAWYHGHRGLTQVGAGELMMISLLMLIGAVFFTASLRSESDGPDAGQAEETSTVQPARTTGTNAEAAESARIPNSIAVLPFQNLSPDPANAYFADGLHDELLVRLDKIKSISPISRQSVMQYQGTTRPSTDIGRELKVTTVLESSVSRGADRIAVRTRLVDASTGVQLWSEAYDREVADVFAVQADIAMNIANALQAEFSSEEQARIERIPTESAEAYSLYLRAVAMGTATARAASAIPLYERAIALDPDFADPYGSMAGALSQLLVSTTSGPAVTPERRAELQSSLRSFAQKALQLDPEQAKAHGALGVLELFNWRWSEAEAAFHRAAESGQWTDNPIAVLHYVYLLSYTGRNAEAIALAQRAHQLNPGDRYAGGLGFAYGMAGNYAAAADVWRAAQAQYLPIQSSWLAFAEIARGNLDEAREQLALAERGVVPDSRLVFLPELAYGFARAERPADARRLFKEIETEAAAGAQVGAGTWAMAYLATGDQKRALEWLEAGAQKAARHEPDPGFLNLLNLRMNVTNDPVLRQPEFAEVLSRIRGD